MLLDAIVRAAFPLWCPGCGRPAEPVCAPCERRLRLAPPARPPRGVDVWLAPFAYEGVARELVARVKYRQAAAAVPWLAERMSAQLLGSTVLERVNVVTWAPTTVARRRARGFDHAQLLARAVTRSLRIPLRATLRRGPGPPQTGLPRAARRTGPRFEPLDTRLPAGVLLIDDVATTGATVAAAAAALRSGGARIIAVATAARTPGPATGHSA